MPIKTATNYLAASNDNGRKQTTRTNSDSSRARSNRTLSNFKNVVKGSGIAAVTVPFPVCRDGREPERDWRVLLDSGSDGDLIFVRSADVKSINPMCLCVCVWSAVGMAAFPWGRSCA